MLAKWKTFSDDEIAEMVQNSTSYRQVAAKMGYKDGGSIISILPNILSNKNIDTSHFTG